MLLKNMLQAKSLFIHFLIILVLSNTHTHPFWPPKHTTAILPMIGVLAKEKCRMLYEQPLWRNLGLSVCFKGTEAIVDPSNSPVYKSSFLGLEPAPFRSLAQNWKCYATTTIKMMHRVGMIYGTELGRWKLNRPAIQQRRAWAARRLWKYIEKTVLHLPVCCVTSGVKGNAPAGSLILEKKLAFTLPSAVSFQLLPPVLQFRLITTSNLTTDTGSERFVMLKNGLFPSSAHFGGYIFLHLWGENQAKWSYIFTGFVCFCVRDF